jgi:hypothetical protein
MSKLLIIYDVKHIVVIYHISIIIFRSSNQRVLTRKIFKWKKLKEYIKHISLNNGRCSRLVWMWNVSDRKDV